MYTIVGLGNPGKEYANTRHNVGWIVLRHFVEVNGLPSFVESSKYAGSISEGSLEGEEVTVLLPDTYMNKSGSAVKKLVTSKEAAEKCIVVYDDVDLPAGEMKLSFGKGSGGHNGVQSVITALGTKDFIRIRIGIAGKTFFGKLKRPKGECLTRHVLGPLSRKETKLLDTVSAQVDGALKTILREGIEKAMSSYN